MPHSHTTVTCFFGSYLLWILGGEERAGPVGRQCARGKSILYVPRTQRPCAPHSTSVRAADPLQLGRTFLRFEYAVSVADSDL